jgi:transposase InsO family protein
LDGEAAQVLCDGEGPSTTDDVIHLLKRRFGSQDQCERYRAELQAIKRKDGTSLQSVYSEVRRVMALAFPGEKGTLWEITARNAFLNALRNETLRERIMERDPQTLDAALKTACHLEAIVRRPTSELSFDGNGHKLARAAAANDGEREEMERRMRRLESTVGVYRKELEQSRLDNALLRQSMTPPSMPQYWATQYPPATQPVAVPTYGVEPTQYRYEPVVPVEPAVPVPNRSVPYLPEPTGSNRYEPAGAYRPEPTAEPMHAPDPLVHGRPAATSRNHNDNTGRRRPWSGNCYGCGLPGHRVSDCPTKRAAGVSDRGRGPSETYIDIDVCGTRCHCLLDTGCERSLVPRKLVPTVNLRPTDVKVYAANDTEIPLLGSMQLCFTVQGIPLKANLLVTDAVEELMLGIDWLTDNGCQWLFDQGVLIIRGRRVRLRSRPSHVLIRRVYVREDTLVPPGVEAHIPVNMTWSSLRSPKADWLIEPKKLRPGVFISRTLLPGDKNSSVVRVVNSSDYQCKIKSGQFLGDAEPAVAEDSPHAQRFTNRFEPAVPVEPVEPVRQASASAVGVDHLGVVIDSLPDDLSDDERNAAMSFIRKHADVFSSNEFDIGRTYLIPHKIDTENKRPFRQPLRRHPLVHEQYIDDTVNNMLQHDIIEPAASPWASNVVLAKKGDGSLRFCVDYRQLNELTYKDCYPLPRISACLDALGGSSYFSTLDLRSGFWQTAIDPHDADKTAFITRRGQFRFKVLSFGLANAPSLFQRIMDLVLAGLSWECCLVYVDDIIVFSKTFELQATRLALVFKRLQDAGLKLRPDKCKLFQRKVAFLGCVVSENGIEPNPEKVKAITEWPVPKSAAEVHSFVGLCSYYRSFIKDLSIIAAPLFNLTKKCVPFRWDEQCQRAFGLLKERLVTAPVLAPPRDGGGYILDVDACDYGIGAVLQQPQDGALRVVGYASKTLSPAERVYCTTRKEQLAVVYGLKQFRAYVLGHQTVVRSDHAALSYLKRAKEPVGQQARWLDYIEQFNLEIQYRRGASHINADALSRRPCEVQGPPCPQCTGRHNQEVMGDDLVPSRAVVTRQQARREVTRSSELKPRTEPVEPVEPVVPALNQPIPVVPVVPVEPVDEPACVPVLNRPVPVVPVVPVEPAGVPAEPIVNRSEPVAEPAEPTVPVGSTLTGLVDVNAEWSAEWLSAMQRTDPVVSIVHQWLSTRDSCPSRDEVMSLSPELKTYVSQWDSLVLINDVAYRKFERPEGGVLFYQLIAPKALRAQLLELIHAGAAGHFANKKTREQVQRRAYWTTWRSDTERFCRNCGPCNQFHRGKVPRQGVLQDMRVGAPMERVQVDLTGPHPPANGYTYICTCICSFTKYVVAWPIRDKRAITVAKGLVERVIIPLGTPHIILTDNGKEFENELWHEICRILGVNKQRTTTYHPACNGAIERWHRSMNALLGKTVEVHQKDWPQRLPYVVSAYNGSVHESTGFTPNFLMFGRELNVAVDVAMGNPSGPPQSVNDYAAHLTGMMADAYEEVRVQLGRSAERQKQYYDFSAKPREFEAGDLVWLYSPRVYLGRTPKWSRCYSGPWEVVRRVNAVNYAVRRSPRSAVVMVHVNKLKAYQPPGLGPASDVVGL